MKQSILLITVLALSAATATGQVTWTGPATVIIYSDILPPMAIPGADPTAANTANGVSLTGDINLDLTGIHTSSDIGPSVTVLRPFTVGPLPVEATMQLDVDLKFVNGLGTALSPTTHVGCFAVVFEGPSTHVINELRSTQSADLQGNGLAFINGQDIAGPWMLSPGRDYTLVMDIGLSFNYSQLDDFDFLPPTTVTVEFGGISSFTGLEATLITQVVPEPATLGLLLVGGLALLRRRRI